MGLSVVRVSEYLVTLFLSIAFAIPEAPTLLFLVGFYSALVGIFLATFPAVHCSSSPVPSCRERRERELHEAYKNARSQEEAEGILQQYIERFTISEAVLERLEMPKILERSHSTEPNLSSFPNDPSPMKYLRQQSLPPPKFTATVEATIARTGVPETSAAGGCGSPSKSIPPSAVPMLTPKPYTQPKASQEVLKTFKVG